MQWKGRIGKNCKGSSKWPNRIGCERKEENGRERELEEIRENRRADKREMGWKYREREREKNGDWKKRNYEKNKSSILKDNVHIINIFCIVI